MIEQPPDDLLQNVSLQRNRRKSPTMHTFIFSADTAFTGIDTIKGYLVEHGDMLDVSDVLDGYPVNVLMEFDGHDNYSIDAHQCGK